MPTFQGTGGVPVSRTLYSNRTDIENLYGKENVIKWADVNNTQLAADVTARVDWANLEAYNLINDSLYGGNYEIPFSVTPASIITLAARQAGMLLYDSRGIRDAGVSVNHMFVHHQKRVDKYLARIRAGQIQLHDVDPIATMVPSAEGQNT
jgi:phage gp36-like protein